MRDGKHKPVLQAHASASKSRSKTKLTPTATTPSPAALNQPRRLMEGFPSMVDLIVAPIIFPFPTPL
jgi:hypothetical protein